MDGDMVARIVEIAPPVPEALFDPETMAREVEALASFVGRISDDSDDSERELSYIEGALLDIARRLAAMPSSFGTSYTVEPLEAAR